MSFNPGLGVVALERPLGFRYEPGTFGPQPELRSLDAIRPSLRNPLCDGPDPVYAIVMDVGPTKLREELERRMLLFGVVTYAAGRLGDEPVRSQGHVHRVSQHSGWRPPEVYEIWSGAAYIYMQQFAADDPGRCYAIFAKPGEIVVVPPGWAHATVSAEPTKAMTFGALCDREYGFEYAAVRQRRGLAWYPLIDQTGAIQWEPNPAYRASRLQVRGPGDYSNLGIQAGVPLSVQTASGLDHFQWVSQPGLVAVLWTHFEP